MKQQISTFIGATASLIALSAIDGGIISSVTALKLSVAIGAKGISDVFYAGLAKIHLERFTPEENNHLQQAFRKATKTAISNLQEKCKEEYEQKHPTLFKFNNGRIDDFFKKWIKEFDKPHSLNEQNLKSIEFANEAEAIDLIADQFEIETKSRINFIKNLFTQKSKDKNLKAFIKEFIQRNIFKELINCFDAELLANEKAFKTFEMLYLRDIRSDVKEIKKHIIKPNVNKLNEDRILTNIPPKPTNFIGRENDIKQLKETLNQEENQTLLLVNGMGGIGKSTLAEVYINLALNQKTELTYQHLAWLTVSTNIIDTLLNLNFCQKVGFIINPNIDKAQNLKNLIHYLSTFEAHNLLVLDNANSAEDLQKLHSLIHIPNWRVLITSRVKPANYKTQTVGVLDESDAIKLFKKYAEIKDEESDLLKTLLEAIEYHTLSIELLAKNLKAAKRYTLLDLCNDLNEKGILNLKKSRKVSTTYSGFDDKKYKPEEIITEMFDLSGLTDYELWLLLQFSVLTPEYFSYVNLSALLNITEEQEEVFDSALDSLFEKGWLEQQSEAYKIHPLIQEVTKTQVEPSEENCETLIFSLSKLLSLRSDENPYDKAEFIYIAESVLSNILKPKSETVLLINNLSDLCGYHYGEYRKALEYQIRAIQIGESTPDINKLLLATLYSNISVTYQNLSCFNEAIHFQLSSIKIKEELLEYPDRTLGISYSSLGSNYNDIGNHKKALEFHKKAVNIFEKLNKEGSVEEEGGIDLASAYDRLAICYKNTQEYDDALTLQKKAIILFEKYLEPNHPFVAGAYNNIGNTFQYKREFGKALEFLFKSLKIRESYPKKNYPSLSESYSNIGFIYSEIKDYPKALFYQNKDISIKEKCLPKNNLGLAGSCLNISVTHLELENCNKAKYYIDKSVEIYQYNFPNGHPNLTNSLVMQQVIYQSCKHIL